MKVTEVHFHQVEMETKTPTFATFFFVTQKHVGDTAMHFRMSTW